MTVVIKWNGMADADNFWRHFKLHFIKIYKSRLDSSPPHQVADYHGVAEMLSDDNSLGPMVRSISQVRLANTGNTQAMASSLLTITMSTNELQQALLATQQQLAALT